MNYYSSFIHSLFLCSLLLINTNTTASSQSIINTLPGYPGTLPFKLETGYIGVGEEDEVQLFYYFIQSENDPERDPLILWLDGGPGCSSLSGLVYEIGPLAFDIEGFDGSLPSFTLNPYSWTKIANIIFLDYPVGTGFSYAATPQAYNSNDTKSAQHNYSFLRKWLLNHPSFLKNRMYIAGDSHGGKITPMLALEIVKGGVLIKTMNFFGNEAGLEPRMLLQDNNVEELKQGYVVGNSVANMNKDYNEKVPYAHRMALISDEYFEIDNLVDEYCLVLDNMKIMDRSTISASKEQLSWEYGNPDPENVQCLYALQLVKECVSHVNEAHILEPICKYMSPRPNVSRLGQLFLEDDPVNLLSLSKQDQPWCRIHNYATSIVWANDEASTSSSHQKGTCGTITEWKRCNPGLSYKQDVESVLQHHRLLHEKGFQALAYSGDHDMVVPYLSTLKWIRDLNLTLDEDWRPWIVDGQVAGVQVIQLQNTSPNNVLQ
ncbi:UNVERIFIED_CONTAM: Serine carboxypeptidase-like 18 [Sesamum calycinum]|uniref:Serine carboxypeptidase-like 18 n=1 Tax=Sesamum calycinum TaxID=2727403 RepID=A0AAW2PL09_9LAMI